MNKWENSFGRTSTDNNKMCQCSSNQGLFIPNRQLSAIVAIFLLLFFTLFMTGYFWGKKKAVEQFTHNMQQDVFADQIYTTVLATQESQSAAANDMLVTHVDVENSEIEALPSLNQNIMAEQSNESNVIAQLSSERYYAQLIGFGTEKAAQLFVKKLAAKGIETEVKKRTSKTAKGHSCSWYQVVTALYADKNELSALVNRLAKEENIKDASIQKGTLV